MGVTSLPPNSPRTITLSTADLKAGRIVVVKDQSGQVNPGLGRTIVIMPEGGGNIIDGGPSVVIAQAYGFVQLYANGTQWFMIGRNPNAGGP